MAAENILTEENKNDILKVMEENIEKSKDLKVLANLPSNQGVEDHIPEEGHTVMATIAVDPKTGEKAVVDTLSQDVENIEKSLDEKLEDMNSSLSDIDSFNPANIKFTPDDIRKAFSDDTSAFSGIDVNISDNGILELLSLIEKYKSDNTYKIKYSILPDEVKKFIDSYLAKEGIVGYSIANNSIRNEVSEMLVDEFVSNISINKCMDEFNESVENMYKSTEKEISPIIKEYNDSKSEMLEKALGDIQDEDKRKVVEDMLYSIHQAYTFTDLAEAAKRIKIKPIDLRKERRTYEYVISKYRDNKNHIYDLSMVEAILQRHLLKNHLVPEDDTLSARMFFIAFSKYCFNYVVEVPANHAFMYYTTYNITLLDLYKEEQYNEYAPDLLKNIMVVVNNLKK